MDGDDDEGMKGKHERTKWISGDGVVVFFSL